MNRAGAQAMAPPALGQPSAERIAAKTAPDVAAGRDLYLEVMLNGQRTSLIAHFRDVGGRLSATGKDLSEIGMATDKLGAADTASIELDQIPGLRYEYDASRQTIDL
ncbi:MAG: fimbrial biogenesis outer membrane usher protein, partial [Paraburkholderia nemoris]